MWNNERVLGVGLLLLALLLGASAFRVPFLDDFTLGPAALPLVYAAGLALCAAAFVLRPSPASVGRFADLVSPAGRRGVMLFVFAIALASIADLVGFPIAIGLFSLAVLVLIERWPLPSAIAFSLVWAGALYVVFVRLLGIPLGDGSLFG